MAPLMRWPPDAVFHVPESDPLLKGGDSAHEADIIPDTTGYHCIPLDTTGYHWIPLHTIGDVHLLWVAGLNLIPTGGHVKWRI